MNTYYPKKHIYYNKQNNIMKITKKDFKNKQEIYIENCQAKLSEKDKQRLKEYQKSKKINIKKFIFFFFAEYKNRKKYLHFW